MQLPKTVALIETCDSHALASAVRILLLYASTDDIDPPVAAGQCTKLYAEVIVDNLKYQVKSNVVSTKISAVRVNKDGTVEEAAYDYSSVMRRCEEENKISFFDGSKSGANYGLERYEAKEECNRTSELARATDGMGATSSFKRCLKDHLNRRSAAAADEDNCAIRFIDTVCFWDDFGKMRDLHYEGKPLLVKDPSPDNVNLIKKYYHKIDRQKLLIMHQIRIAK